MQIQVKIDQMGPSTAEAAARTRRVLVGRPVEKGGEDRGMMGGEYLLTGLGGCFMSNLLAAIRAREADIGNVHLEVNGTLAAAPSRFSAIEVVVYAQAADRALLVKLVEMAARACISSNTLRQAVPLTFRIAQPS